MILVVIAFIAYASALASSRLTGVKTLGARMVAVIDAWDAMTSDRPYRKALSREIAIDQLRKGSGTQFDPKVVDAFLALEAEDAAKESAKEEANAGHSRGSGA